MMKEEPKMHMSAKSIEEFVKELASGEPIPGGGAAAALSGAQGVALLSMVANHTIGKKKYAEYEALNKEARNRCSELIEKLLAGVDADAEAFQRVATAYALPRESDEEQAARSEAIAIASVDAALAPLECMRTALEGLKLCGDLMGKSNANLVSDLYVAAKHLGTCISSAKYNVDANLPYLGDPDQARGIKSEASDIIEQAENCLAAIFDR